LGAHGEVQVMDWGLAKRLQGRATPDRQPRDETNPDATLDWHT